MVLAIGLLNIISHFSVLKVVLENTTVHLVSSCGLGVVKMNTC